MTEELDRALATIAQLGIADGAMADDEILREIERRLAEWFKTPGWAEENAGLYLVEGWIEELKATPKRDDTFDNHPLET
jgi:hypothetical protein